MNNGQYHVGIIIRFRGLAPVEEEDSTDCPLIEASTFTELAPNRALSDTERAEASRWVGFDSELLAELEAIQVSAAPDTEEAVAQYEAAVIALLELYQARADRRMAAPVLSADTSAALISD